MHPRTLNSQWHGQLNIACIAQSEVWNQHHGHNSWEHKSIVSFTKKFCCSASTDDCPYSIVLSTVVCHGTQQWADWKFDDRSWHRTPIFHHLAVRFGSRLHRTVSAGISLVSVVKIANKTTGEAFMLLDLFLLDAKLLSSGHSNCIHNTWDQHY